jgi:hypothetical protein
LGFGRGLAKGGRLGLPVGLHASGGENGQIATALRPGESLGGITQPFAHRLHRFKLEAVIGAKKWLRPFGLGDLLSRLKHGHCLGLTVAGHRFLAAPGQGLTQQFPPGFGHLSLPLPLCACLVD